MCFQEEFKAYLLSLGLCDVGFSKPDTPDFGDCPYAVTLVAKLSNAIIDEIRDTPTHTYFHHYRTVNAFLDQALLKAGIYLDRAGYRYLPVAASQSINKDGWNYRGRFSHKQAACEAGLGTVGRSSLFLHNRFGPRVRLATLFTDYPFSVESHIPEPVCGSCRLCADACPSGAILGGLWAPGVPRESIFSPERCSLYMKQEFQPIGRASVCGLCISVCPRYEKGAW